MFKDFVPYLTAQGLFEVQWFHASWAAAREPVKGADGALHAVAVYVRRRALWTQESGEAGRPGAGRVLLLEFTVHIRAVTKRGFRDKGFTRSAVPTLPAEIDTTKAPLTSIFTGRRLFWLGGCVARKVYPQRHPLSPKPPVEATPSEGEALP